MAKMVITITDMEDGSVEVEVERPDFNEGDTREPTLAEEYGFAALELVSRYCSGVTLEEVLKEEEGKPQ